MPTNTEDHKISLIITAWNEAETVAKALDIYSHGTRKPDEVVLICPDVATKAAAEPFRSHFDQFQILTDPQQGKPNALNMGIAAASHPLVICTDGDVLPDRESVEQLYQGLGTHAAVGGHPESLEPRSTMMGYWSHFLVDAADHLRRIRAQAGQFVYVSGYLFIAHKELVPEVPVGILSDDAYISDKLYEAGHTIGYAPNAHIYVRYPTHYSDWLKQKRRSAGGFVQLRGMTAQKNEMRSFAKEVRYGLRQICTYPQNIPEWWWTILLVISRLHLWLLIFYDQKIARKDASVLWERIESTK